MFTLLAGLALFVMNYMYTPGVGFGANKLFMSAEGITDRGTWILFGMLFGTAMWFNVWFIIWPAERNNLTVRADEPTSGHDSQPS